MCLCLYSVSSEQIMLQSFLFFFFFFCSIWIKGRRIKQLIFSFFLNRSELLDVLLICNVQECLPAGLPRNSSAVVSLQTRGWWFPCFIQIILFFKYSEQLSCSWDKKVILLARRFFISKGRKWHWEVLIWVYALFENKTSFFFFLKEDWKALLGLLSAILNGCLRY